MLRTSLLFTFVATFALASAGCSSDEGGASPGAGGSVPTGGKASAAGSTGSVPTGGKAGAAGSNGSGGRGQPTVMGDLIGQGHEGLYHRGPVDFAETEWHNACAPGTKYRKELQASVGLSGEYLAGVSNAFNAGGGVCDACIFIETAQGKSIVARVVTYGVQQADGDIDVSPSVFENIHQNENPRRQTWHFARCPAAGRLVYEFKTEANPYWTSLWVRNPRVPLIKAEVKSASDKDFVELQRAGDGTLTDASGFGDGAFTLRLTAMDGQVITEDLPGFKAGALVESAKQFE